MMVLRKVRRVALSETDRVEHDPRFPEHYLYPTGITWQGLPPCTTQNTWYVVAKATGEPLQMLTQGLDGLRRGWDTCGKCSRWFMKCTCAMLTPPAWVRRDLGLDQPAPAASEHDDRKLVSVAEVQRLRKLPKSQ